MKFSKLKFNVSQQEIFLSKRLKNVKITSTNNLHDSCHNFHNKNSNDLNDRQKKLANYEIMN